MENKYSFTENELKILIEEVSRAILENTIADVKVSNYEVSIDSLKSYLSMEDAISISAMLNKYDLVHLLNSADIHINHRD